MSVKNDIININQTLILPIKLRYDMVCDYVRVAVTAGLTCDEQDNGFAFGGTYYETDDR